MRRHVLSEGLLDAGKEGVYSLLTLSASRLSGDTQETDYGVSVIIVLQGLSPDSLPYRVSCVVLFSGIHDSCHIFLGRPLRIFTTCEINGGVNALYVACSGLYCLLPGGHDRYDLTHIVSIDPGHVP